MVCIRQHEGVQSVLCDVYSEHRESSRGCEYNELSGLRPSAVEYAPSRALAGRQEDAFRF